MTRATLIPARLEVLLLRTAILAASTAALFIGGCAEPARYEQLTLGDGPLVASGGTAGANSETLFDTPDAAAIVTAYGREALPEYARLDDRMNIAGDQSPRLATSQWPQDPAPDLNRVRVIYLPLVTSPSYQPVTTYRRERDHYWQRRY